MAISQTTSGSSALQLTKRPDTNLLRTDSLADVMSLGQTLAKSGYFGDAKEAAQAVVKILAGKEMGIGPIAAMTGIYIVKGKVSMSANLMAACLKSGGRYDYKVRALENDKCSIEFFEYGESLGVSSLTLAEAKAAKLDQDWYKESNSWKDKPTWKNFPKNMLFARALSNGVKFYCPNFSDRASGPVYTPEELGATVDGETGEVIDVAPDRQLLQRIAAYDEPQSTPETIEQAEAELDGRVTKVHGGYDVVDSGGEVFEVRKDSGVVVCSCGSRGDKVCLHRRAVMAWVDINARTPAPVAPPPQDPPAEPDAIDAELEPVAPNFNNEAHAAAFAAQAPSPNPEPVAEPQTISKSQLIEICGLTKQLEAAGVEELTWRDQLEKLTGCRSRKGLMADDVSKVRYSFEQALAAAQRKGGKGRATK